MSRLFLEVEGPAGPRKIEMGAGLFFAGRAADNDLVLPGAKMPEVALKAETRGDGILIEALEKNAEMLFDGKRTRSLFIRAGQAFEGCGHRFRVLAAEGNEEAAALPATLPKRAEGAAGREVSGAWSSLREALARFAERVGGEEDLGLLLQKLARGLPDLVGGTEAYIFALSPEGNLRVSATSKGPGGEAHFSDSVVQEALKSGRGLHIGDALADPRFESAKSVHDLRLGSALCCPIRAEGRRDGAVVGAIYLGARDLTHALQPSDLEILETHAVLAGLLIDHVERISRRDRALEALRAAKAGEEVIAQSPAMRGILKALTSLAQSDITVLLEGETGTGKDVAAEFLHKKSRRSQGPFVAVNCGTLRGELLASELFGYKKGAFTGAFQDRKGLFAQAQGGSLFLDEMGDLDPALQASLLRVLEKRRIRPVGGGEEEAVDVRIICATNRDLKDRVKDGSFRADLFYRINQCAFLLPPLRERAEDIPLLAYHFLRKFKAQYPDLEAEDFHPEALQAMTLYAWPGNVRELVNAVHKAVLVSTGPQVKMDFLPLEAGTVSLEEATLRFRREYVKKALLLTGGSKEKAAEILGVSRATVFRLLDERAAGTEAD